MGGRRGGHRAQQHSDGADGVVVVGFATGPAHRRGHDQRAVAEVVHDDQPVGDHELEVGGDGGLGLTGRQLLEQLHQVVGEHPAGQVAGVDRLGQEHRPHDHGAQGVQRRGEPAARGLIPRPGGRLGKYRPDRVALERDVRQRPRRSAVQRSSDRPLAERPVMVAVRSVQVMRSAGDTPSRLRSPAPAPVSPDSSRKVPGFRPPSDSAA